MRNLARAIADRKDYLTLAKNKARQSQCTNLNPLSPEYFNEGGFLVVFYKVLNRFFLTGSPEFLVEAHKYYVELEEDGWVVWNGRLINPVFKRALFRIELIIQAWFYKYAMDLNHEWLRSAIDITVEDSVKPFQRDRLISGVQPTSFASFKKQIESFNEIKLKDLTATEKENYLQFLDYRATLEDWDYRNPCDYFGFPMYSTEINVPVIELEINELIYRLARVLGLDWASKYITEPTARNEFIKNQGLIL